MQVELVYDVDCPNIAAARLQLVRAFSRLGMVPRWREWDIRGRDAPEHVRNQGSPTILINRRDASAIPFQGDAACCRVYLNEASAASGVPALDDLVQALESARATVQSGEFQARWGLKSATLPAIGVALLPKIFCPACWPAYTGLLSAIGLGFFDYTPYLLPLTAIFLFIAVASLAWRAKVRRGYRPLLVGLVGSAILLFGKFIYDSDLGMYAGIALLVAASLWNAWPRAPRRPDCPECETGPPPSQSSSRED